MEMCSTTKTSLYMYLNINKKIEISQNNGKFIIKVAFVYILSYIYAPPHLQSFLTFHYIAHVMCHSRGVLLLKSCNIY